MNYSPNIGQLARNKLNLNLAKKQQFLANANTINFCIEQISTGSLFNLIGEDDEHYLSMKKLASDPRFLQQAHTASSSNQNNSNLVKFCYNVTVHKSKQTPNFEQMKCFGKIQIPKQDSQYFPGFINNIITVMRRLDHRQPLKAAFQLKKNVLDVISTLDPNFDCSIGSMLEMELGRKQSFSKISSLMRCISEHTARCIYRQLFDPP